MLFVHSKQSVVVIESRTFLIFLTSVHPGGGVCSPQRFCLARSLRLRSERLVSSRRRHLLFDVPVIGPGTIDVMIETNTTALAVDAGRTLMLDKEELLEKANAAKIAIVGMEPA